MFILLSMFTYQSKAQFRFEVWNWRTWPFFGVGDTRINLG